MSRSQGDLSARDQRVDAVLVQEDIVSFVVLVHGPALEAPRVSVRARGAGLVDVVGVEERGRSDGGGRIVAFLCEAERGAVAFDVDIVVDRPGLPVLHLAGPAVLPAVSRGAPR